MTTKNKTSAIENFRDSSSFKMASLFAVLLIPLGLLIFFGLFKATESSLTDEAEIALQSDLIFLSALNNEGLQGYAPRILQSKSQKLLGQYFYLIRRPDTDLIEGNLPAWPEKIQSVKPGLIRFDLVKNETDQTISVLAKTHTFSDGTAYLVGRPSPSPHFEIGLYLLLGLMSFAIIIFIAVFSYHIGLFVVKQINVISGIAHHIMLTGNLSQRIPIENQWNDLGKLAIVLNKFIEAIEQAFLSNRRVTDNIAHDLKTPLSNLRNKSLSIENKDLQESIVKDIDHLLGVFNALLRITEIESAKKTAEFETINLKNILEDCLEWYEPLIESQNLRLSYVLENCEIQGDRDLFFQAITNLLDNAVKFTPEHGKIEIKLHRSQNEVQIDILNTGLDIPDTQKGMIFDRFFRSELARSTPGNGLGLTLTLAIIKLHQGLIQAKDHPEGQGAYFQIRLPKQPN
jgi:signal transduction histidine kinase